MFTAHAMLLALWPSHAQTSGSRAMLCSVFPSSLSQWVHGCDALELPLQERKQLDAFIDQLYKDIEKGSGCWLGFLASFPGGTS